MDGHCNASMVATISTLKLVALRRKNNHQFRAALVEFRVDFPGFVQLNHHLYLMTGYTAAKLFETMLHLLGRTSVEDELPHSASRDDCNE